MLATTAEADAVFVPLLDRELRKISEFYATQERDMQTEFSDIETTVKRLEERGVDREYYDDDEEDEEDDDESISRSPVGRRRRATSTTEEPSSPKHPRAHFQIPESPILGRPRSRSYSHTFARNKRRSTSAGIASTFQSFKDTFTSGGPSASTTALLDSDLDSIWTSQSNYAYDTRLLLKRRITKLYISLTELRSYTELNYTGFRKIIKKYDKVVGSHLETTYLSATIQPSAPFCQESRDALSETIRSLTDLYAKCITMDDVNLAQTQLKAHQREQIAWERDTVWRLMIGRERRGEVGDIGAGRTRGSVFSATAPGIVPGGATRGAAEEVIEVEETTGGATLVRVRDPPPALFRIPFIIPPLPNARGRVVRLRVTKSRLWLAVAVLSSGAVLKSGVIADSTGLDDNPANACFAVLVFCTILWASEVRVYCEERVTETNSCMCRLYPYLSPRCLSHSCWSYCALYAVQMGRDCPLQRLPSKFLPPLRCSSSSHIVQSSFVFSNIFSSTIMLLIGGFTISSALSKTNIDKLLITRVLSMAGTKPPNVLLAFMAVSCFASMWIRLVLYSFLGVCGGIHSGRILYATNPLVHLTSLQRTLTSFFSPRALYIVTLLRPRYASP